MATSVVTIDVPAGLTRYKETDLNETKSAVKASAGTMHSIIIDNTANGAASFVKLYDVASGSVTVGTTAPDWIFKVPASTKRSITFMDGGIAFATALTAACVTAGGTAGTTGPTSDVDVTILSV